MLTTTIIPTPNGLRANDTLNALAKKLEKKYKSSVSIIHFFFDVDFDGLWSMTIEVKNKNKAVVLKESNHKEAQWAFLYLTDFQNQPIHDHHMLVRNSDLFDFVRTLITNIYKIN